MAVKNAGDEALRSVATLTEDWGACDLQANRVVFMQIVGQSATSKQIRLGNPGAVADWRAQCERLIESGRIL